MFSTYLPNMALKATSSCSSSKSCLTLFFYIVYSSSILHINFPFIKNPYIIKRGARGSFIMAAAFAVNFLMAFAA